MNVVHGMQSVGERDNQEDAFRIVPATLPSPGADLLMLLADGMGGHVGGEVASSTVVEAFEQQCISGSRNPRPGERMHEAMVAANEALRQRIRKDPQLAGMGSTLVSVIKLGNRLFWLSVGDSLLYLYRDGELRRLNADHSVQGELMELVRAGTMRREEAENHPRRNALRSALIGGRVALVDANSIVLKPKDVVLLASDGIETLSEAQIAKILAQPDRHGPRAVCADLLNAVEATQKPRQDNTTIIAYRFDPDREQTSSSLFAESGQRYSANKRGFVLAGIVTALALLISLSVVIAFGVSGGDTPTKSDEKQVSKPIVTPSDDGDSTIVEAPDKPGATGQDDKDDTAIGKRSDSPIVKEPVQPAEPEDDISEPSLKPAPVPDDAGEQGEDGQNTLRPKIRPAPGAQSLSHSGGQQTE